MVPFLDFPVDGFTLLTSFTYPAAIQQERRWLENDRVNALRQSTLYNFKGYVVKPIPVTGQVSYTGQVRALPGSWLYAISSTAGPGVRIWDNNGSSWTMGIPINAPLPFQTFRNLGALAPYINLDEPWFLADGVINYEVHNGNAPQPMCFFVCEARPEIKGELLSACLNRQAVEF